jgi:hypothetical protein
MAEWQAEGWMTPSDALFYSRRERIVTLTQANKLLPTSQKDISLAD